MGLVGMLPWLSGWLGSVRQKSQPMEQPWDHQRQGRDPRLQGFEPEAGLEQDGEIDDGTGEREIHQSQEGRVDEESSVAKEGDADERPHVVELTANEPDDAEDSDRNADGRQRPTGTNHLTERLRS